MTKKVWRFASVGAGRAAVDLTIGAVRKGAKLADMSSINLVAISDLDIKRARAVAQEHNIPHAYRTVEEMLSKAKPDVLVINTPVPFHYPHAMAAIKHGVHFIIEKPATENVKQLIKIRDAAEKKGVKGTVVHNYKWQEGFQKAFSWYQQGLLGEIIHADRIWMTPAKNDRMERDPNGWYHKQPGGRLADSMPHHLYVIYPFMGPLKLEHVSVKKLAKERTWSKCDEADILLSTKTGYANIRLSTNQESWPRGKGTCPYDLIIYGTKQAAVVFKHNAYIFRKHHPTKLVYHAIQDAAEFVVPRLGRAIGLGQDINYRGGHNLFYKQYVKYLEDKAPNPTPWDEAIFVMKMSEEIAQKMETQARNFSKVRRGKL